MSMFDIKSKCVIDGHTGAVYTDLGDIERVPGIVKYTKTVHRDEEGEDPPYLVNLDFNDKDEVVGIELLGFKIPLNNVGPKT